MTRPGSGKTDAPVLVAVSASSCVIRATSDSTQGTLEEFASAHVSRNHEVRCDGHGANLALLGGWPNVVARKSAGDGDSEDSLPTVHHIISNFKAMLAGTHHGVSVGRLQEYYDQFSWRYSHRLGDALLDLLRELVRWPHVRLRTIKRCRKTMRRHPKTEEPGKRHNEYVRRRHKADIEALEKRVEEWKGADRELMRVIGLAADAREEQDRLARERERERRDRLHEECRRVAIEANREYWAAEVYKLEDLCRQAFEYGW